MAKSPKSPETEARLAAALRENLKKRKTQARAQASHGAETANSPAPGLAEAGDPAESGATGQDKQAAVANVPVALEPG